MNILIPHSWLLEHLETEATPQDISKYLSLSGPSVERINDVHGEPVYDIEVTTNRVDVMSVRGIAREAAVILTQFGIPSTLKPLQLTNKEDLQPNDATLPLPKIYNHPTFNKRTFCIVLRDIKRNPTPEWMGKRLIETEMNVHDAVIDITNYVTHELGHPCHAFDYDKLMNTGGEIHIEEAKKGEKFLTLDGLEFITIGGEVVFKNGEGDIIDLPSIKGTANTSIDESTQNVLLLAESIRADKVRFASMTHAIRTTAAQLMEKNVDPNLAEITIIKGVQLYQELCDAHIGSQVYDDFPGKINLQPVRVSLQRIDEYLGLKLEQKTIVKILEDLECEVRIEEKNGRESILTIQPPTFRPDITIPADIVEEIARIYGYHNLPSKLMETEIPIVPQSGVNFHLENAIKHFLADIGWQEVFTYSMVGKEIAQQSGYSLENHLRLQNSLTDDHVYLRRSLLPSLEEVLRENPQRTPLSVFEIANLYTIQGEGKLPLETMRLSMVSTRDYRRVRGDVEALLHRLFVTNVTITPAKASTQFSQEAEISATTKAGDVQRIGKMGVLKSGHIAVGIAIASLLGVVRTHPHYEPIAKTMPIVEDLTFYLPRQVAVGKVLQSIKEVNSLIRNASLKDVYQRNHTFTIEYHDAERNISSVEVTPIRNRVISQVETSHQAKLIGSGSA